MNFVNPQFFWVMIIPLLLFAFLITTNKERLSRVFDRQVLKRLSASDESMPQVVRNTLMFFALFLMIVAMARPVMEKGEKNVEVEGLTLLVALDISGSMRSKDMYPNRLTFAKQKMSAFFDTLASDKVGIMAFAYNSFVLAPFSSDKETLKMMLEGVDDSYINMGSTDFSALGRLASSLLEEKKPKILVLFSDGGDEEALKGFKEILKQSNIDLYVVLIGTSKGAPVLDEKGKTMSFKDNTIAMTQRNDSLGEIAKAQGGAYVVASNGNKDMRELSAVIQAKYQKQYQGEVQIKQMKEYFYYPLGLSLFLLLLSLSSLPKMSIKRKKDTT